MWQTVVYTDYKTLTWQPVRLPQLQPAPPHPAWLLWPPWLLPPSAPLSAPCALSLSPSDAHASQPVTHTHTHTRTHIYTHTHTWSIKKTVCSTVQPCLPAKDVSRHGRAVFVFVCVCVCIPLSPSSLPVPPAAHQSVAKAPLQPPSPTHQALQPYAV